MRFQIPDTLKTLLGNAILVIAFLVISAIAEQIEPLVRISRQLDENPQPWLGIVIGIVTVENRIERRGVDENGYERNAPAR